MQGTINLSLSLISLFKCGSVVQWVTNSSWGLRLDLKLSVLLYSLACHLPDQDKVVTIG